MMLALALSLASAVFGALSNVAAKHMMGLCATRDFLSVNFAILFVTLLPFAPIAFKIKTTPLGIGAILLASLVDAWANYFYFRSFEMNDAATASGLLSVAPLFTLLLMLALPNLGSSGLTIGVGLGVATITAGVVLLNQGTARSKEPGAADGGSGKARRVWLPIAAAALFGGNTLLLKYILSEGIANPYSYYLLRAAIISLVMYVVLRPRLSWVSLRAIGMTFGRGIFVIAQWLLMLYALALGSAAVVKAVSETTPLFVLMLSPALLRERLDARKVFGVVLIICGLVAIAT